jgi:pimeloyl-ACP methyl ester carboxylesterase
MTFVSSRGILCTMRVAQSALCIGTCRPRTKVFGVTWVLFKLWYYSRQELDPLSWRSTAFDEVQNGLIFVTKVFGDQLAPSIPPWMLTWIGIRGAAMSEFAVGACLKGTFGPGMAGQMEVHRELVRGREIPRLAVYMREENAELERGLGIGKLDHVTTIEGAGHWFHHVKADDFNKLLQEWLQTIEK